MNIDRKWMVDTFLKYVSYDTQSCPDSTTFPSTDKQLVLAEVLKKDCEALGLKDVTLSHGYVIATLPSNIDKDVPTIGFLAHMDTVPDVSGKDIKPNIIENYDGGDIHLASGLVTSVEEFPDLKNYVGMDIITTDGTTLLGADDKAGIAEILAALRYLIAHPEIQHGAIKVAFTPDEEIGSGLANFDAKAFGADFAYTVDGGKVGGLTYETFNAAKAKVTITGKSVHTGSAKNIMINAGLVATDLIESFPKNETPATTEGYEGFYHLMGMTTNVENAVVNFIIRDHDKEKFNARKEYFKTAVDKINEKYGPIAVLEMEDQYYNMAEKVNENPDILKLARTAMAELGIEVHTSPARGGTDGSALSFMGIPCPDIFTGGGNFHGPYEYVVIDSMVKSAQVILKIITLNAA